MAKSNSTKWENRAILGLFVATMIMHFWLATFNWTMPFMPGHEFRQAQTALISYYIDLQNNFSLLYEAPILGKPWVSILLEVPIYEWAVVGLSRSTGWPHVESARAISLACFYLTLPAVFGLLQLVVESGARRLLVLALILCCPVYLFYSRAFLIDSMALMFCAWFLLGFWRTMAQRSWVWLALTTVACTGAALIKSATLAIWLIPGAVAGAWMVWRDLRAGQGWCVPLKTALWGVATVAVGLGSLRWWVMYTDPIKEAHASANLFTSANLSQGNWGLLNFASKFSPEVWKILFIRWSEAIMAPWLIGAGLVAGFVAFPKARAWGGALVGVFIGAQLLFPFAYAYQDYYFYSCAMFLVAAFGVFLLAALDSRLPRWCVGVLIAVPFAAQLTTYWEFYRPQQEVDTDGVQSFLRVIQELTPKGSVIVAAGADWAAMTPLYTQRKALMVRSGLEYDKAYLKRAFDDLDDEDVSAVIIYGDTRNFRPFVDAVTKKFDMDPSDPTYSHPAADVYIRRLYVRGLQTRLRGSRRYGEITIHNRPAVDPWSRGPFAISPAIARTAFALVKPGPFKADFEYGFDLAENGGVLALSFHPDSDLWLHPPAGATQIVWDFGFLPEAYEREGDQTDGVDFYVRGELPDGQQREIYHRLLDPNQRDRDRGPQHEVISYQPVAGETLHFFSRSPGSKAYDWVFCKGIEVR